MKSVKVDLSKDLNNIDVCIFADEHIGDPHCDMQYLKDRIKYVETHKNAYAILDGDLMDNATKTSVSDTYAQKLNPQESMDMLVDLFKPIKNKILCITQGNHEARTYKKEGIDIMKCVADRLGLSNRYDPVAVLLFLRFGTDNTHGAHKRKKRYTIYVTHGSGGGRKEGAKAIRLADLACICDADIYVHAHTHLPFVMKEDFARICESNSSINIVTKLFVNSSSNLNYGGYGEALGCKPSTKKKPMIHLNYNECTATL